MAKMIKPVWTRIDISEDNYKYGTNESVAYDKEFPNDCDFVIVKEIVETSETITIIPEKESLQSIIIYNKKHLTSYSFEYKEIE